MAEAEGITGRARPIPTGLIGPPPARTLRGMTEPERDLQAAVDRLAGLTAAVYEDLLARSARGVAAGEWQPDPLQAYRFDGPPPVRSAADS